MKLPDKMTIGEAYSPAMEIKTQKEADEYLEALIERTMRIEGLTREKAEEQLKSNLGYYAGYYDEETRRRVEELFQCSHPIFGKASKGIPTVEEAFNAGVEMAKGDH